MDARCPLCWGVCFCVFFKCVYSDINSAVFAATLYSKLFCVPMHICVIKPLEVIMRPFLCKETHKY